MALMLRITKKALTIQFDEETADSLVKCLKNMITEEDAPKEQFEPSTLGCALECFSHAASNIYSLFQILAIPTDTRLLSRMSLVYLLNMYSSLSSVSFNTAFGGRGVARRNMESTRIHIHGAGSYQSRKRNNC